MKTYTLEELRDLPTDQLAELTVSWAKRVGIFDQKNGSSAIKQLDKASEEFNELQRAIATYSVESKEEVIDAFGDILVCLINAMAFYNLKPKHCLAHAYNTIQHRKGKMLAGKFVKLSSFKEASELEGM